ncbi:hypothetical protein G4228_001675 [Cervus hanglu yarkandensis]|nr:hypothetical protein G4228_001675 [Cervus hanglu yarkandensis]
MAEVGNDCYFFFNSTCIKQNCSISCFWETQPLGCVKISCIFYHSKPRNINGLFLPPSSNITLQKDTQEGIPPPTQSQEPLKPQENISRPIHHPLVLKTNFEEEEEEEGEQNDASSLWTKTPEEIEEKRAIKEMCYKSGEYYRVHTPSDISSSKSIASIVEKEIEKSLESGSELQEGDGLTVPTKFSLFESQGEIKASLDRKPRTDIAAFENGVNDVHPVKKPHFKGVKKRKWMYDEPKNFPGPGMRRAVQTSNPKSKMSYHRNNKNKNSENASCIHVQRDAVRTVSLNAPPHGRPSHGSYIKADVNKEPKFNLCSDCFSIISSCNRPGPSINIYQRHIMVQPGEKEFLFQKRIQKMKRYIQVNIY